MPLSLDAILRRACPAPAPPLTENGEVIRAPSRNKRKPDPHLREHGGLLPAESDCLA